MRQDQLWPLPYAGDMLSVHGESELFDAGVSSGLELEAFRCGLVPLACSVHVHRRSNAIPARSLSQSASSSSFFLGLNLFLSRPTLLYRKLVQKSFLQPPRSILSAGSDWAKIVKEDLIPNYRERDQ